MQKVATNTTINTKKKIMDKDEIKDIVISTVTPMLAEERAYHINIGAQLQNFNERFNQVVDLIKLAMEQSNKRFEAVDKRFEDMQHSMDKRFEDIQHYMDKRFEAVDKRFEAVDKRFEAVDKRFEEVLHSMDKRFEDMQHYMDKRFEAVDKRFEDINKRMNFQTWFIGVGLALVMGLIAFLN